MNTLQDRMERRLHQINASASILITSGDSPLFSRDEDTPLRAASVIKVPIMMEAFRQHQAGTLNLGNVQNIHPTETVGGAGVIHYLSGKQDYTLRQLIELMIIVSDNTAANLVLKTVGMENVNALLKQLGCEHSMIERFFMDSEAIENGLENWTTARDMIICLQAIHEHHPLFIKEDQMKMKKVLQNQQFKDLLGSFTSSEEIMIYHKTGELEGAEHDAGIFEYRGKTIYAAVLTDGLSRNQEGREMIASVGQWIAEEIAKD